MAVAPRGPAFKSLYTGTPAPPVLYTSVPTAEPVLESSDVESGLSQQPSTRWRAEVLNDAYLRGQLELIYKTEPRGATRTLFGWKERDAMADFFFNLPELIPASGANAANKTKESIAQIVVDTGADTRGLGPKWAQNRRLYLRQFYDELHAKMNRERELMAKLSRRAADSQTTGGGGGGGGVQDARRSEHEFIQLRKVQVTADIVRTKELLASCQHSLENNQHYNVTSLLLFARYSFVMLLLLLFSAMLSLDIAVLVISAVVVSAAVLWSWLLARSLRATHDWRFLGMSIPIAWVGKRTLALYVLAMMLVSAGYLVLALWRSILYNYGTGTSKTITLVFLWILTAMLFAMTLFAISILSVKKTVGTWISHIDLPSASHKALSPKRE